MNLRSLLFALLGCLCCAALALAEEPRLEAAEAYRLAPGDVLAVEVYGEADLSTSSVKVDAQGFISLPLLGPVKAEGSTVAELNQAVADALRGDFLVDPQVLVSIVEHRPYFLQGEVAKPGPYPYRPGLTLRQAITIAGGLTERASRRRMYRLPENQTGSKGTRITMDTLIQPGDQITIEQSFF